MADTSHNNWLEVKGNYFCTVKPPGKGWLGEKKGTPFIRVPLVVEDGPQEGKEILWYGYLTDAAFDRTIQTLAEVFGFDGDLDGLQNGTVSFAGQECRIVTDFEEYKGESRLKVKWLNSAGGGQLDEATAKPILDRLRSRAKAVAAAAGKGKAPDASAPGKGKAPF